MELQHHGLSVKSLVDDHAVMGSILGKLLPHAYNCIVFCYIALYTMQYSTIRNMARTLPSSCETIKHAMEASNKRFHLIHRDEMIKHI